MVTDDGQDLQEEGWQAHDLRSGVAKVYAEAKRRSTLGIRVAAVWAVVLLAFGGVNLAGTASVTPPLWDFALGFGVILLAALSVSRAPAPLLGAAASVIADLVMVAYRFPEMLDHGTSSDHIAAALRIVIAPVAVFVILNGYFGSLSIQAFKAGFSPGADWRTRINPAMMNLLVIGSCVGALLLGFGTWLGAIASGFAQTDVVWVTRSLLHRPIQVKTARNVDVAGAARDGGKEGIFADITVLNRHPNPVVNQGEAVKIPESAQPISSVEGLDAFTKREVEDAFEFGADTDEAGCILEGHGRQDRCPDDRCRYWARVFARACLTKSRKTEHFCDDVPGPLLVDAGLKWAQAHCAGRNFETCREILYAVQGHCHPPSAVAAKEGDATSGNAKPADSKSSGAKRAPRKPAAGEPAGGK